MTPIFSFILLLCLAAFGYFVSSTRANSFAGAHAFRSVHSRPGYHGWFSVLWTLVPALIVLLAWVFLARSVVEPSVLQALPSQQQPTSGVNHDVFFGEVRGIIAGDVKEATYPGSREAAVLYSNMQTRGNWLAGGLALALASAGVMFSLSRVRPDFRARTQVEKFVMMALIVASIMAVLTTFGILFSLLFESMRFFDRISPIEFLFGTHWSPQEAMRADQVGSSSAFGAVPLFWGTFLISLISMFVAVPIGLLSAIYLTQYASQPWRKTLKPMLEVLAGVPTVVYGFFAALTVAPMVRDFGSAIGLSNPSSESALAAGLVMGVMIIPFMSSLSDDAITAVPQAMKDGSLAMGATSSETIRKVLIPAALPGIMGGFLLALSRAIGETMIVVMAAGLAANLTANPFNSVTTVTTQIVALLTGDQEFDSAKTLSAFALGLVLFLATLALNIYALRIVKKYREAYD